jgi:HK97 family phage major capsid protein
MWRGQLSDRFRQLQGRLPDRRTFGDQILRDPFTNKPFVHFYATKRVGGQVLDSAAIKLLKIEA